MSAPNNLDYTYIRRSASANLKHRSSSAYVLVKFLGIYANRSLRRVCFVLSSRRDLGVDQVNLSVSKSPPPCPHVLQSDSLPPVVIKDLIDLGGHVILQPLALYENLDCTQVPASSPFGCRAWKNLLGHYCYRTLGLNKRFLVM